MWFVAGDMYGPIMIYKPLAKLDRCTGAVLSWTVLAPDLDPHPLADEFLHDLRFAKDASLKTCKKYAADLAFFLNWMHVRNLTVATAVRHMTDYTFMLRTLRLPQGVKNAGRPRSASRCNDMLTVVRSFYDYALDTDQVPASVERMLWRKHGKRGRQAKHHVREVKNATPRTIPEEHVRLLLNNTANVRDTLLLSLMRYNGLRTGQVHGLHLEDMHLRPDNTVFGCDIPGAHMHIIRRETNPNGAVSKARHEPYLPVSAPIVRLYASYIVWRDQIPAASDTGMLFVNQAGQPLGMTNISNILTELCDRLGLPHYTPHMFRHTFASTLLRAGKEKDTVQRLLGQLSPQSIEPYNWVPDQLMRTAVDELALLTD